MITKIILTYFFISILISPIIIAIGKSLADHYYGVGYTIGVILQLIGVILSIIDVIIIFCAVIAGIIRVIWGVKE